MWQQFLVSRKWEDVSKNSLYNVFVENFSRNSPVGTQKY